MTDEIKRYRLGNQPELYELSVNHLGWTPVGFKTWDDLLFDEDDMGRRSLPIVCKLRDASGEHEVAVILHQWLSKDAFPLHFFGEDRFENWHRFVKVSYENEPLTLFVIPMH